jgi:TonB-dependent receptor-like protein
MRGHMRRLAIAAAALLAIGGCKSSSQGKVAPRNRNLITADEIAKSNASNAYEAVERLRPSFLQTRGPQSIQNTTPPTPNVYVDGMRYGTVQSLQSLPALSIIKIEYMNALDATQRFGIGNDGGAILVTTKH